MADAPTRDELLELIDWLWNERHDPTVNRLDGVNPERTPLAGWTIEAALAEHSRSADAREAQARDAYVAAKRAELVTVWREWDHLTEEERNHWRRDVRAPQYQPTPPRPILI